VKSTSEVCAFVAATSAHCGLISTDRARHLSSVSPPLVGLVRITAPREGQTSKPALSIGSSMERMPFQILRHRDKAPSRT